MDSPHTASAVCILIRGPQPGQYAGILHHRRGQIELPGGKKNPGESLYDAVKREALEEAGLRVLNVRPLFTFNHRIEGEICKTTVFAGDTDDTDIRSSREGPVSWCTADQLCSGNFKWIHTMAITMVERGVEPGIGY